jgi:hypothetical protein
MDGGKILSISVAAKRRRSLESISKLVVDIFFQCQMAAVCLGTFSIVGEDLSRVIGTASACAPKGADRNRNIGGQ